MKWSLVLSVLVLIIGLILIPRGKNNVCKTFSDYYTNRDNNENCYHNPDYKLEAPDIIKRHEYPVETHYATTKDGYILSLFRIPHGRKSKHVPGKPVLIGPGISTNAVVFLFTGKKSIALVLADAGYDVWITNFRGSKYSLNHTRLDNEQSEYWNFSVHEHGIYDLPASLDLINEVTGKKVIYIGFSMGTTAEFIYSSVYPEASSKKMEVVVSITPAVFFKDLPNRFLASYGWWYIAKPLTSANGKVVPNGILSDTLFQYLCLPLPIQMQMCQLLDMFIFGFNYEQNDPETLPVTLQYKFDATSVKTVSHYAQLVDSGNFQYYNYGPEENQKVYGSSEPPHYKLSEIITPHRLIYALNDKLSTKKNVEFLYENLSEAAKKYGIHAIKDENFNHLNSATGKDVVALVYAPIISFLKSLKN